MPDKKKMKGGGRGATAHKVTGTEIVGADGNLNFKLNVDSKKTTLPSKQTGGKSKRRSRKGGDCKSCNKVGGKSRRKTKRGGADLGTALLPFAFLWGQKSYQHSSKSSTKRRSKFSKRRNTKRRR